MRRLLELFRNAFRSREQGCGPAATAATENAATALEHAIMEGDRHRDSGDAAVAARFYADAAARAPQRADLRVQLANMLKDSGQWAQAETEYRRAAADAPQDPDIHLQRGHLFKRQRRSHAAMAAYRDALAVDPSFAPALTELAEAGDTAAQERLFATPTAQASQLALLTIAVELERLRQRLDEIAGVLPNLRGQAAWPVSLYPVFRERFAVPAPRRATSAEITILLPADRETLAVLHRQIEAVRNQSLPRWRLVAFGDDDDRRRLVELAASGDTRISWHDGSSRPAAAIERDLAGAASGDWVVFIAAGAVFDAEALAWIAAAGTLTDGVAVFCDEEIGRVGRDRVARADPVLRSPFDVDTLLEGNVFGETIAVRAASVAGLPPPPSGTDLAPWRSAMLLALADDGPVSHIPYPLVWRAARETANCAGHEAAVRGYLAWTGLPVGIGHAGPFAGKLAIDWHIPADQGELTVVIATRDNAADVRLFVDSLLATAAQPALLSFVVIDNASADPEQCAVLEQLAARAELRVVRHDGPFNWSALNNRAASLARGDLLIFANDDMRMLSAGWDLIIRGLLARPEVGAVGARLLYDDDTIQHAGILLGWRGSATHDGLLRPSTEAGPADRWQVTRSVAAVTGAFLATRRHLFEAVGGFDAAALPVAYSDVDYALKLRHRGLKVLYTPRITVMHHESKTRGLDHLDLFKAARADAEMAVMRARWPGAMVCDPFVHPLWQDAALPFQMIAPPAPTSVEEYVRYASGPGTARRARDDRVSDGISGDHRG